MELWQPALLPHPAWNSLMLDSLGVATPQHSLQHQLEQLSLTLTQTELLLGAAVVHSQTHKGMPGGFSWDGGNGACLVGIVLWPRDHTTAQSRCEGEEQPVRRIYMRMSGSSLRQHSQNNANKKEYLELAVKGAVNERLPRRGMLKTCDFCQEKEGFSSDYRGIIAGEV